LSPTDSAIAATPGQINLTLATRIPMTWFLIESGVALLLLVFIVWWTMPRRERSDDSSGHSEADRSDPD
jgi:hypothetical protein